MSDAPQLRPSHAAKRTAARAARAGTSLIWLVPIIALAVTLGLAWNSYSGRGELISVTFRDATGIVPGETTLKFREITVGEVESVRFTGDLRSVVVDIRVEPDVSPYIDTEAEFWIVRPIVSAQGISRLDTVLSGVFVEGFWDAEQGQPTREFIGLDKPTLARAAGEGTWVVLSSPGAKGLAEGAPVTFRGLEVGRMQNLRLSEEDESVLADVFIEAPHDQRLTTASAFWDTSGFSVSLGAGGLSLNVDSLSKLVQGGVAFATMSAGGQPVEAGYVFRLQQDEETARASLFGAAEEDIRLTMLAQNDVAGLATDADVTYEGLTIGRVTELGVDIDESRPEDEQIMQRITFVISPGRLGLEQGSSYDDALQFLADRVESGLRARVSSTGFLGTTKVIELIDEPRPEPASLDLDADPYPIMPSAPPVISDLSASAEGLMDRLGSLNIEELLQSATNMMDAVTQIAAAPDTRAIPGTLRETLEETRLAAADIKEMTAELREQNAAANLSRLLDEAAQASEAVRLAAAEMPDMVEQIDEAAEAVEDFGFEEISAQAEAILSDLRIMLGSEDAEELPRNLSDTLEAASGLLNDLRDGNAAGSLNDTLASARVAADEVAEAAQTLPELSARFQRLAARAEQVIAAYGDNGAISNDARAMIRELGRAASSFGSLARTIERNPRAFILGR
ncbi:intermembrane transport protein PqiB [Paracoccus sediminicola]|uniref:PqiB family protein n=1 Tax=Paracoccus sediminicola TaxID=3017783 RepID=UPI0022F0A0B4|nr:MlaD family protein [Paracoccus sediminicola]WBU56336.1 MlaD family protein [Paracoccus sediminicola]